MSASVVPHYEGEALRVRVPITWLDTHATLAVEGNCLRVIGPHGSVLLELNANDVDSLIEGLTRARWELLGALK